MRSGLKNIQRCPWCGNFLIITAIKKAFEELGIKSHQRVLVSGIWCSGKAPQYIDSYAGETLHGRAIPFATWVKLARPDMTVLAMGWDGDGYGIGMGHFIHACRKNLDITYLVFDNENYALTTGQASPMTSLGAKTKTTPEGNTVAPFNPIKLATEAGCGFARQALAKDLAWLVATIKEAILHSWFALVDIIQDCPSFKRW